MTNPRVRAILLLALMWTQNVPSLVAQDETPDKDGRYSEPIERALAYQRQQPPHPDNHEWLAVRLLFEYQFGTPVTITALHRQLIHARSADGGWSWNKGKPSDSLTTGLAVYVLAKVRGGEDPAVIADARRFLLTSQQSDGSWLTPAKDISNTTVPERLAARDEIYHYWGTAWSAIGLLETLTAPSP